MNKLWRTGTVVIPAQIEVDKIMRKIPSRKLVTTNKIHVALAKKCEATIGCPMTTDIFAWVTAHAAEERKQHGQKDITHHCRTLKPAVS